MSCVSYDFNAYCVGRLMRFVFFASKEQQQLQQQINVAINGYCFSLGSLCVCLSCKIYSLCVCVLLFLSIFVFFSPIHSCVRVIITINIIQCNECDFSSVFFPFSPQFTSQQYKKRNVFYSLSFLSVAIPNEILYVR